MLWKLFLAIMRESSSPGISMQSLYEAIVTQLGGDAGNTLAKPTSFEEEEEQQQQQQQQVVDDGPVITTTTTTTTTTTATATALPAPSSSMQSESAFKELLLEPSSSLTTETAAPSSQHLTPDFSSISYDTFNTAEILGKITKEDILKSYGVQPLEFLLEIDKEPPLGGITFDPELILVIPFIICQINTIHFKYYTQIDFSKSDFI